MTADRMITALHTLAAVPAEPTVFWQVATYLVLGACVLVIVAAAVAVAYALVYEPLERLDARERADAAEPRQP